MAKGYSVRYARNYYRGKDGKWKLHSVSCWDSNGYTRTWPTVEEAEAYANEILACQNRGPEDEGYVQYCRIYLGKDVIKTVERKGGVKKENILVMAKRDLSNGFGQRLFSRGFVYEAERNGARIIIQNELGGESVARSDSVEADFEIIEDFDMPAPATA